jgi:hypothetical protein
LVLLAASVVVMPVFARGQCQIAMRLGDDRLILADAADTKLCVLLSLSTLAGLGLFAITGTAWLDPSAGFIVASFAIHEGREAWFPDERNHPLPGDGRGRCICRIVQPSAPTSPIGCSVAGGMCA